MPDNSPAENGSSPGREHGPWGRWRPSPPQAAAAAGTGTRTAIGPLSHALLGTVQPQMDELLSHGWTIEAFVGNGNPGALRIWAQQAQWFFRYKKETLQILMAYGPTTQLRDVFTALIQRSGDDLQLLGDVLAELGADTVPSPAMPCEDYGCWLYWHATHGLMQGAVTILATEAAYCEMFKVIDRICPAGSPWRPSVDNWASLRFQDLVYDLRTAIDQLTAGEPAPDLIAQMAPVAERGLQRERTLLDMFWFGHGRWLT